MLELNNISIIYGERRLLDGVNCRANKGEKIALTGRNGAGKSTLLKIISGELLPHDGRINKQNNLIIGYLKQELGNPKKHSILDELDTVFEEINALHESIERANQILSEKPPQGKELEDLLHELDESNNRYGLMGGYEKDQKIERVLIGLGFKKEQFNNSLATLSGGWKMRVELARILLTEPDVLLLDEPTNHLDIESIIWLEQYLKSYRGVLILISHDQQFLDTVCNRTIEIERGQIYDYKANYSKSLELREERIEKQKSAYKNQQKVISEKERLIKRFMAKESKTKMAQSMQKQLNKMERVEIEDPDLTTFRIRFPEADRTGEWVLKAEGLSKNYGPKEVLDKVDFVMERKERVAFVGQNGQGKTTLARILINQLEASSGKASIGHNVKIAYYAQDQSDYIQNNITVLESLEQQAPPAMRTQVRSILGAFMFSGEDVEKKVSVLSGGERARLAMATLLMEPSNLLVLDEPTNHLDILSKEVLKKALLNYGGALLVVSHDRAFLRGLCNKTIDFRDKHIHTYLGDVDYFLQKKSMQNMREVEQRSQANSVKKQQNKPKIDHKERKRLLRAVSQAEKRIENLEQRIQEFEQKLVDPVFFKSKEAESQMNAYSSWKKDLENAYAAWEKADDELTKRTS